MLLLNFKVWPFRCEKFVMSEQESETEPAEQRLSQEVIQTETDLHEEDYDSEDQRRQNERKQQEGEINQIISSSDVGNSTATGEI